MRHEARQRSVEGSLMKIFAISDLHLSLNNPKPMNIFGPVWEGYEQKIFDDWREKVGDDDLVLLAGDFSWAMRLDEAKPDFELIKDLPGKKVLIRGNHDYWWSSISAVRAALPQNMFAIQNDAIKFGDIIVCGTRGWTVPENGEFASAEDEKIFKREVIRLDLTLKSAKALQQNGEKIICMMHYPPCNFKREDSEFTKLLCEAQVACVVFGHLHGYKRKQNQFRLDGINYYLTSCDMVENKLTELDV